MQLIADAMNSANTKTKIDKGVMFDFGNSSHRPIVKSLGTLTGHENERHKRIGPCCRRMGNSARDACLPAVAVAEGGDSIVKVTGHREQNGMSGTTDY